MKLTIVMGHRYFCWGGKVFAKSTLAYDPFFKEYLNIFDQILVVTRTVDIEIVKSSWARADGPNVSFCSIPDYKGLPGFLAKLPVIITRCKKAIMNSDVAILRLPEAICFVCWLWLLIFRKVYGTTLVMDGFGMYRFLKPSLKNGLSKFLIEIYDLLLKLQIKNSSACSYVGRHLIELYPSSKGVERWVFSTVQINEGIIGYPKKHPTPNGDFKFITTSNMIPHKGIEYILESLSILNENGFNNWTYTILGDGPERKKLKTSTIDLGINDMVFMPGYIEDRQTLFKYLDASDLFLFGSFAEGMPRAAIEAAARGLPIISTDAGSIRYLIEPEWIVPIKNASAMAETITRMINNRSRYMQASIHNIAQARCYCGDKLLVQKLGFLTSLKCKAQR